MEIIDTGFAGLFSSGKLEVSLLLPDHKNTYFTKAFLQVLSKGSSYLGEYLSIKNICDLMKDDLKKLYIEYRSRDPKAIRPPDPQIYLGNIADIPLFPNTRKGSKGSQNEVVSQPTILDKSEDVKIPQKHISQRKAMFQGSLIITAIVLLLSLSIFVNSHIPFPMGLQKSNSGSTLASSTPSRVSTSSTHTPQSGNLLTNGNFEQGTKWWDCFVSPDPGIQSHHEGTRSWVQANIPKRNGHQDICDQDVHIDPQVGKTYTASILVRATRPTIIPITGLIALWMIDENTSGRDVNKTKAFTTNSTQWISVPVTFTVPNPWYTLMRFAIGVDNSTGVSLDMTAAQLIQDS